MFVDVPQQSFQPLARDLHMYQAPYSSVIHGNLSTHLPFTQLCTERFPPDLWKWTPACDLASIVQPMSASTWSSDSFSGFPHSSNTLQTTACASWAHELSALRNFFLATTCNNIQVDSSHWHPSIVARNGPVAVLSVSDLIQRCNASAASTEASPYADSTMHSLVQRQGLSRQQVDPHCQNMLQEHGRHGQFCEQQRSDISSLQQLADNNFQLRDTSLPLFAPAQQSHSFPPLRVIQQPPQQCRKQSPDSSQESAWADFKQDCSSAPSSQSSRLSALGHHSSHLNQTDVLYLPVSKVVRSDSKRNSLSGVGLQGYQQSQLPQLQPEDQQHILDLLQQEQQAQHISQSDYLDSDMLWDHPTLPLIPTRIRRWATRRAADVIECEYPPDREDVIRAIKAAAAEAPQWRARFAAAPCSSGGVCDEPLSEARHHRQPAQCAPPIYASSPSPVQFGGSDLQAALAMVVPCLASTAAAAAALKGRLPPPNTVSCSLPVPKVSDTQNAATVALQQSVRHWAAHALPAASVPTMSVMSSVDRTLCAIDMNRRISGDSSPFSAPAWEHLTAALKSNPACQSAPVSVSPKLHLSIVAKQGANQEHTSLGAGMSGQEGTPAHMHARHLQPKAGEPAATKPPAPDLPAAKGSRVHAVPPAADVANSGRLAQAREAAPTQRRRRDTRAEDDEDYEAPTQRTSSGVNSRPRGRPPVSGPAACKVPAPGNRDHVAPCVHPAGEVALRVQRALVVPVSTIGLIMQQGEQQDSVRNVQLADHSMACAAQASFADDECMDSAIGAARGLQKASHSSQAGGKSLKRVVAFSKFDTDGNGTDSDADMGAAPAKVGKRVNQKKLKTECEEEPKSTKSMRSQKYTGVYRTPGGRWRAQFCHNGAIHQLGMYPSEQEAALGWDKASWVFRKDKQHMLNFPGRVDEYSSKAVQLWVHSVLDSKIDKTVAKRARSATARLDGFMKKMSRAQSLPAGGKTDSDEDDKGDDEGPAAAETGIDRVATKEGSAKKHARRV